MSHTSLFPSNGSSQYKCPYKESIPFLDTLCKINNGKTILDLYKKDTNRNLCLLPSSCHPPHQHENIPFSLSMRIVRICSLPESRDWKNSNLKQMSLKRNYRPNIIDDAITKARSIPRSVALKEVSWDPRLPLMANIQQKHWWVMTLDRSSTRGI